MLRRRFSATAAAAAPTTAAANGDGSNSARVPYTPSPAVHHVSDTDGDGSGSAPAGTSKARLSLQKQQFHRRRQASEGGGGPFRSLQTVPFKAEATYFPWTQEGRDAEDIAKLLDILDTASDVNSFPTPAPPPVTPPDPTDIDAVLSQRPLRSAGHAGSGHIAGKTKSSWRSVPALYQSSMSATGTTGTTSTTAGLASRRSSSYSSCASHTAEGSLKNHPHHRSNRSYSQNHRHQRSRSGPPVRLDIGDLIHLGAKQKDLGAALERVLSKEAVGGAVAFLQPASGVERHDTSPLRPHTDMSDVVEVGHRRHGSESDRHRRRHSSLSNVGASASTTATSAAGHSRQASIGRRAFPPADVHAIIDIGANHTWRWSDPVLHQHWDRGTVSETASAANSDTKDASSSASFATAKDEKVALDGDGQGKQSGVRGRLASKRYRKNNAAERAARIETRRLDVEDVIRIGLDAGQAASRTRGRQTAGGWTAQQRASGPILPPLEGDGGGLDDDGGARDDARLPMDMHGFIRLGESRTSIDFSATLATTTAIRLSEIAKPCCTESTRSSTSMSTGTGAWTDHSKWDNGRDVDVHAPGHSGRRSRSVTVGSGSDGVGFSFVIQHPSHPRGHGGRLHSHRRNPSGGGGLTRLKSCDVQDLIALGERAGAEPTADPRIVLSQTDVSDLLDVGAAADYAAGARALGEGAAQRGLGAAPGFWQGWRSGTGGSGSGLWGLQFLSGDVGPAGVGGGILYDANDNDFGSRMPDCSAENREREEEHGRGTIARFTSILSLRAVQNSKGGAGGRSMTATAEGPGAGCISEDGSDARKGLASHSLWDMPPADINDLIDEGQARLHLVRPHSLALLSL